MPDMKPEAWLFRFNNGTSSYVIDAKLAAEIEAKLDANERMTVLYSAEQLEQAQKENEDALRCFRMLIEFLLRNDVDEKEPFLQLWHEGAFEECRKWWPEAPTGLYPAPLAPRTTHCSVCGEEQFESSGGMTCCNGHGGAPAMEDIPS